MSFIPDRARYVSMEMEDLSDDGVCSVYCFNGFQMSVIARNKTFLGKRLTALEHLKWNFI